MRKTLQIHLAGLVFHIEEEAYQKLNNYLENIRQFFSKEEGREEIMDDIEARIAERFQQKLEGGREVVIMEDVDETIEAMGEPEEFAEPFSEEEEKSSRKRRGQVYRNPDNKILGGVCGGIAAYFDIDPLWLRLGFAMAVIFWGTGVLVYLILWLIIPEASTPAEKLEMRGENVTVANIRKTINEEWEDLQERVNEWKENTEKEQKHKVNSFFERLREMFLSTVHFIGSLIGRAVTMFLVLLGAILLVAGVFLLVAFSIGMGGMLTAGIGKVFFTSPLQMILGLSGLFLLAAPPIVALFLRGAGWLFQLSLPFKTLGTTLSLLWVAGIILTGIITFQLIHDFNHKAQVKTKDAYLWESRDTLQLTTIPVPESNHLSKLQFGSLGQLQVNGENLMIRNVNLKISATQSSKVNVRQAKSARGADHTQAEQRARQIPYTLQRKDDRLQIPTHFQLTPGTQWRAQQVEVQLLIPEGTIFQVDQALVNQSDQLTMNTTVPAEQWGGHTFRAREDRFVCLDCQPVSASSSGSTVSQKDTNIITKTYDYEDFDRLDVEGNIHLKLTKGESYDVQLKGVRASVNLIDISQSVDKLIVERKTELLDLLDKEKRQEVTLSVTMPQLRELNFSGSAEADISGFEEDEVWLELSGATETTIDFEAEQVDLELSGASELTLRGSIDAMGADIDGASQLKAYDCTIEELSLYMSGASKAWVHVTEDLQAKLRGASKLRYKEEPDDLEVEVSTGASLKQEAGKE